MPGDVQNKYLEMEYVVRQATLDAVPSYYGQMVRMKGNAESIPEKDTEGKSVRGCITCVRPTRNNCC